MRWLKKSMNIFELEYEYMSSRASYFCVDLSYLSGADYIQRQSLPLAVPAAIQSWEGWNWATAGTALIPSPPSCASCSPLLV